MQMSAGGEFDARIPSWGHYYDYDLSWSMHVQNIAAHVPLLMAVRALRPRRILEVGSGTGSLAICMSYLHGAVVSVDLSEPVLDRARRNNRRMHGRTTFQQGDAFHLDAIPDLTFDVAVSQGFFEHFDDDAIERLIREQLRVARFAVFSVPNRAYGRRDRGDERLLTRGEWEALLSARGFKLARSGEYRGISRRMLTPAGWRRPPTMYLAAVAA